MDISEIVHRIKSRLEELYTHDRAFVIVFFFAVLIRCYGITLPYVYDATFQQIIARNHLIYGNDLTRS